MLDAIAPAAEAASRAAETTASSLTALQAAAKAARDGAAATTQMVARVGRASRLGTRTLGHPDPGATSIALMLQYAVNALEAQHADATQPAAE